MLQKHKSQAHIKIIILSVNNTSTSSLKL